MTVFTRIARGDVIGRFSRRINSVMAEKACSEDCIMIKVDGSPACCAGVATLAGVEAQDMVGRFSWCKTAVMAGEA